MLLLCGFLLPNMVPAKPFRDRTLESLNGEISKLSSSFAHIKDAESLLGVKKAREPRSGFECSPLIARVSHIDSLLTDVERPQVLLSGEIHGDERIGPEATLHTGYLMVNSARCAIEGDTSACNKLVNEDGLSKPQIVWLANLATRRDTFLVPSCNCLGYKASVRADAMVDPNRDFAYSRDRGRESGQGSGNDLCLRSTTAKIFNKLMELTLFQLVITFHGGMQAIAYEWGSLNHRKPNDASPDDHANKQLGETFSYIGGYGFPGVKKPYPFGPMNSIVYGVDGGMEDWMYAAGWDRGDIPHGAEARQGGSGTLRGGRTSGPSLRHRRLFGVLHNCTVETNSRHPPNNRALVFLVETSDRKRPADNEWGDSSDILGGSSLDVTGHPDGAALGPGASTSGNGHVPRNVRLALATVDAAQPYVCVNKASKAGKVPGALDVQWSVGGAFSVDATWLSWHPAEITENEMSSSTTLGLGAWQVLHTEIDKVAATLDNFASADKKTVAAALAEVGLGTASDVQSGSGLWGSRSSRDSHPTAPAIDPFGAKYSAQVRALESLSPGEYWLAAWAVVDKSWGHVGQGFPRELGPQSWLSLARTNTSLHYTTHAHPERPLDQHWPGDLLPRSVRGRVMWASAPLRVRVAADLSLSVVAATLDCAWWARGPIATARNPIPPLKTKIDAPDDKKLPTPGSGTGTGTGAGSSDNMPQSPSDSDRSGTGTDGMKGVGKSGKSMQSAVTLLVAFVALLMSSYAARKALPIVFARLQSWRHRRSLAGGSGGEGTVPHMRLAQSEDEAEEERERALELEMGLPAGDLEEEDDD